MTKQFLKDNNVSYEFVDVDLTDEDDRAAIREDIQKKGGALSYPTTIVDNKTVIMGFRKDLLKEAIELW